MIIDKNKYKLIFIGTPEFAVPSFLSVLKSDKFNVEAVITQPDKKSGRHRKIIKSPIKKLSQENNIKLYQPNNLSNNELVSDIKKINPDILLVVAYGKIIPKKILNIPKYGCINIHPSLLPKYRGPSPMQSAILKGDKYSGISIMLMNEKMDAGDILYQKQVNIDNYNIEKLHDSMSKLAADLIVSVMIKWINNAIKAKTQDDKKATYSKIINKSDGKINWNRSAEEIIRQFRAYHPWPGVYTHLKMKEKKTIVKLINIKINKNKNKLKFGNIFKENNKILVATGDGNSIILNELQFEGKKPISSSEFIRGYGKYINKYFE